MYRQSVDRSNPEGLTGQFTGKMTERESRDVLEGKLPNGTEAPVYPFEEFKQGIADLPIRYGVILDYELARQSLSGYVEIEVLKDDPNMIVRTGGIAANAAYLDKFQDRHNTKLMGHWHAYNRINPDEPQTRMLFLADNKDGAGSDEGDDHPFGYDTKYGVSGNESLFGMSRYVAVAPRDVSTDLRNLDFEV